MLSAAAITRVLSLALVCFFCFVRSGEAPQRKPFCLTRLLANNAATNCYGHDCAPYCGLWPAGAWP
jgi:hypothetical protein